MRVFKHWLPVFLWMGVIFLMSTDLGSATHTSRIIEPLLRWLNPQISPEAIGRAHFLVRKTGHLTEYAILALLVLRALRKSQPDRWSTHLWRAAGCALLITAAYASTDEWHQSFVPGRTASPVDVLIDGSGGFLALTLSVLWSRRSTHRANASG